ncbi:MAG: type II toxin-antitoxin system Phd/YefM family antitoxin [Chloroflexi bacterium]|nr:type II toxin-antitoxin system Phd/YefM family antitoxin [Chloroflexota bacterium]
MHIVNINEAKTHLSRLVDEVNAGRKIVIARAGKPVARLVPLPEKARKRELGILAGKFKVPDDFDAPLSPDELSDSPADDLPH